MREKSFDDLLDVLAESDRQSDEWRMARAELVRRWEVQVNKTRMAKLALQAIEKALHNLSRGISSQMDWIE